MKKQRMILLILLISLMTIGCVHISPSIPGSVDLVNPNEGAYGYGTLFRGEWSKDDLLAIDPDTGGLMWAVQPLGKFRIESALSRDFHKRLRLDLTPNTRYTLYIYWTRFYGRELSESVVPFRTYIDPRRRCCVDKSGRRRWECRALQLQPGRLLSSAHLFPVSGCPRQQPPILSRQGLPS